ncbi:DUF6962 family protein [Algivirga pacifica]|uniref:DUF4203 domain-containing protein n=1 Tax=Algivirga pacifica TaxID=1162670 RepID=A0ABP9DCW5_9BACT
MELSTLQTSLTTAATDLLLGVVALFFSYFLYQQSNVGRGRIWGTAFLLLALGAIVGGVKTGLVLDDTTVKVLQQPFFFSLSITVSLFVLGVLWDFQGGYLKEWQDRGLLAIGGAFYLITVLFSGVFLLFLAYAATAMLFAGVVYFMLYLRKEVKGALWVSVGIALTLVAFGVQASKAISFHLIWDFDHNGVFHLIQLLAVTLLYIGVQKGMRLEKECVVREMKLPSEV